MNTTLSAGERQEPRSLVSANIGAARLAIGLLQGVALYLLYSAARDLRWPATEPFLFVPLLLAALLPPVVLGASLGHMALRQVWTWTGTTLGLVLALGLYDVWRVADIADPRGQRTVMPSGTLLPALLAGLFIAHSLVMAAVRDRRRIASYPSYFETAWKLCVQLAFSAMFIGLVWLVLFLGAQLFLLVKLDFLSTLLRRAWFAIPVSVFAFSCAMHLTDVRPAIVRGIRALLLMLMSWVLPVMTLIVGAFLLSLPFTGLAPLWATRHAAAVLIGTAAVFIVLINAAWQDGDMPVARVIGASARAASVLLVPITAIAIYALALRVGDYGWTSERVTAAACLLVASCYSLGYAGAALRPGGLAAISQVNVGTAFVVLATLLLLFSPVADPARLSVDSQLARLRSGKVPAAKFDFAYLRFEGARYGRAALTRLDAGAAGPDAAVTRARIAAVRKMQGPWGRTVGPDGEVAAAPDLERNLRAWPKGSRLPDSFLHNDWASAPHFPPLPECLRVAGKTCDAFQIDLGGDAKPEVVLVATEGMVEVVYAEDAQHRWSLVGNLPPGVGLCAPVRNALAEGRFTTRPGLRELEVAGVTLHVRSVDSGFVCPQPKTGTGR
jgi:hypothetical protein